MTYKQYYNMYGLAYMEPHAVDHVFTYLLNQNMTDTEKQALSLSMNQVLISCLFLFSPCTADDFEWV